MTKMTRRQALRLGASTGIGLVLSRWLERAAHAEPNGKPIKSVVLLWMNGGPSHIDTWDPKKGAVAGPGRSIKTRVPGLELSEHLPRLANVADKLAVLRGMTSKEGNHQRAQYLLRTGYAPNPTVAHPTLAAWVSKSASSVPNDTGLPASISLGGPSLGAGFFGVENGPFVVAAPGKIPDNVGYGPSVDASRFAARTKLLEAMEGGFFERTGDAKIQGRRALYEKAERLMHARALDAFDVSNEPEAIRAAFGDTAFGRGCLTALRLVGAGVRFVEVTLDGWDTHKDNFGRTKAQMEILDPAMSSLIHEMEVRNLRNTIVVWIGDFGRTPKINPNEGRDHHPAAFSAVLAGAGIRGGTVYGETDERGEKVVKDLVTVPNFLATIATAIGLDPSAVATSPTGRPISLTDHGTPISRLLV